MKSLIVFAILIVGLMMIITIAPNSYALTPSFHSGTDYNEQVSLQQDLLWHIGKNLSVGDSYTYKICDPGAIQTAAANYHYFTQGNENHNSSVCYMIKMDFVNLLNSDENQISNDVWVVQAAISNYSPNRDNDVRYSIFHVDAKTFEVSSADTIHPDTIKYTDSLQDTLFSLFKYTAPEPQLLQIGTKWGEVTEALRERGKNPYMTVLDNNQEYAVIQNSIRLIDNQNIPVTRNISNAFKVGYEIDIFDPFVMSDDKKKKLTIEEDNNNVTIYFLISYDLPFPLSAVSYSPVHTTQPQKQFEFELVVFLANSKKTDLGIKPVFEKQKEIVIVSEISTETGTIELTFPDEDNEVPDNNDDIVVNDDVDSVDDDIVHVVPDNDDVINNDDVTLVDDDIGNIPVANNDDVQSDDDGYVRIVGLGILLVVMIAGFVVFKKLKESGFKTGIKKTLKKKQQYTAKEIIQFNDKLHIDIKTITTDDN